MAKAKYSYNEKRKEYYTLVYDGSFNADGSKHRKRLSSKKSSADLEKKVDAFKREVEERGKLRFSNISFVDYANEWLSTAKAGREKNTQAMYKNIIKVHLSYLDGIPLAEIRHSHFQQVINNALDYPRTCQQIEITFKQIIKSAVRDGYLNSSALDNITTDISLPKYSKPQKRPLSPLEKELIFSADFNDMKRCFIMLLYYTGIRREEALALSPADFNFDDNTVKISNVVIFDINASEIKNYPKTDRGMRTIPLPDKCVEIVKPYILSCDGYLFHGQNTQLMTRTGYRRMWESILTSMNIAAGYNPNAKKDRGEKPIQGLTAHIFRHNYCTELCYKVPEISTKMIAMLMGDTEKMVLNVYSHIVLEKENVSNVLNTAF